MATVSKNHYWQLAKSAARARFAYLPPNKLRRLWLGVKQHGQHGKHGKHGKQEHHDEGRSTMATISRRMAPAVFENVEEEPRFMHDVATGAEAYAWRDDASLHLVFRGTQDHEDAMANIDVRQGTPPWAGGDARVRVHRGFLCQYEALYDQIEDFLAVHKPLRHHCLQCTGHSLGGALATLCATHLASKHAASASGQEQADVVAHTFGSPRVGNKAFAQWYSLVVKKSVRVHHAYDPVPGLPFSMGFEHVKGELLIDKALCSADAGTPWILRPLDLMYSLSDHSCDGYVAHLHNLAQR